MLPTPFMPYNTWGLFQCPLSHFGAFYLNLITLRFWKRVVEQMYQVLLSFQTLTAFRLIRICYITNFGLLYLNQTCKKTALNSFKAVNWIKNLRVKNQNITNDITLWNKLKLLFCRDAQRIATFRETFYSTFLYTVDVKPGAIYSNTEIKNLADLVDTMDQNLVK